MNSEEGMMFATVLKLHPLKGGSIPVTHGHHAHAAFLDILRAVDPEVAKVLHASGERKPFTVAPLTGLEGRRVEEGQIPVRPGDALWLRFTLLDERLFQTFVRCFLMGPERPVIRLGRVELGVAEVLATPGSHPWAGYTSAQELLERWHKRAMGGKDNPGYVFEFECASPTAFSLGGPWGKRMEVLPMPRLFFGSLATTWDTWFREVFVMSPRDVRDYVAETMVVSRMKLETRMFQCRQYLQVGAGGMLTYELLDYADEGMARSLNTLADFAFYAGVGYKTTMGMGQVRRLSK